MDFGRAVLGIGRLLGGLSGLLGRGGDTAKLSGQISSNIGDAIRATKLLTEASRDELIDHLDAQSGLINHSTGRILRKLDTQMRHRSTEIGNVLSMVRGIRGLVAPRDIEADVRTATRPILDLVGTIAPAITRQLGRETAQVLRQGDVIQRSIGDFRQAMPGIVESAVTGLIPAIGGALAQRMAGPGGSLTNAIGGIRDRIADLVNPVLDVIATITSILRQSGLGTLADKLSQVSSAMQTIQHGLDAHLRLVEQVTSSVDATFGRLDSDTAAATREGLPFLRDLATGQSLIAQELGDSGPIGRLVARFTDMEDSRGRSRPPRLRMTRPSDAPCGAFEDSWYENLDSIPLIGGALTGLVRAAGGVMGFWSEITTIARWCGLAFLRANPHEPPPAGDVVGQWLRGVRTDAEAIEGLRQWGYDRQEAEQMLATATTPLPPTTIITALNRQILTEETAIAELRRGGMTRDDAERMVAMRTYVLPPQDIIRLAVREVFSGSQRSASNLDADYPAVLTERAAEAGMSERDARDLWAAHWELPSIRQGVEMLHRGVIDADTYAALQRARDVAPAWRERLTAIQYSPITRVDLRRLHAEGVISDERMERGYRDIGYDPADAALMADWTKQRSAAAADKATTEDAEGLTRASIVRLYRLGAISRSRAVALLTDRGISEDAADGYLRAADLILAADAREDTLTAILTRVRAGSVSSQAARNEIAALDLESAERDLALARLERVESEHAKVPSMSQLDRAAKAGLVGETEYVSSLVDQGWSVDWARRFWQSRPGQGA